MRFAISIARDYAFRRKAFGKLIANHDLHVTGLSYLEAIYRGHLQLGVLEALLQGKIEAGISNENDELLLRVLTPISKLYSSKDNLWVISECLEALGGIGYMEDATPLPAMFRGAQVNCIWEGTTNVMSLDLYRALFKNQKTLSVFENFIKSKLTKEDKLVQQRLNDLLAFVSENGKRDPKILEASGREFAIAMGNVTIVALLLDHWRWSNTQSDRAAVDIWITLKMEKSFPITVRTESVREREREIALDIDPESGNPRGTGDVCISTGKKGRVCENSIFNSPHSLCLS